MKNQQLPKWALAILVFTLAFSAIRAQVTNLSGSAVNTYIPVSAVNAPANEITLTSVAGLSVGDTIFIIQMQGAAMNTANSAAFGDISNSATAGKYEFNVICMIAGNTLTLERILANPYDPTGGVQVIPVINHANVNVNGAITVPAWNGTTGGVLVISAPNGYVSLSADINANGMGFRGGSMQDLISGCSCANRGTLYTSYFYASGEWQGARKGEGIAAIMVGMESGRGKQVNGGGGGNDHNSGGAGGSNYGAGGAGGNASASSCFFGAYCRGEYPGIGGLGLASLTSNGEKRLFLGGGGGAGDYGNASVGGGSPGGYGTNGGGIVFILADSISGNSRSINANGVNVPYTASADGGGGGGGGGTVVLDVRAIGPAALNVNARGGNGANHSWGAGANNCKGTGGGGGGGVIWSRTGAIPGNVVTNVVGGTAGIQGGASCSALGNNGSTNGANGAALTSFSRQFPSAFLGICVLPISEFNASLVDNKEVMLNWRPSENQKTGYFEVMRSTDGSSFKTIARINPDPAKLDYNYRDLAPAPGFNWYQIKQVDQNGTTWLSNIEKVNLPYKGISITALYPNPLSSGADLNVEIFAAMSTNADLALFDLSGHLLQNSRVSFHTGSNAFRIETGSLAKGTYFLKLRTQNGDEITKKLVIQ